MLKEVYSRKGYMGKEKKKKNTRELVDEFEERVGAEVRRQKGIDER